MAIFGALYAPQTPPQCAQIVISEVDPTWASASVDPQRCSINANGQVLAHLEGGVWSNVGEYPIDPGTSCDGDDPNATGPILQDLGICVPGSNRRLPVATADYAMRELLRKKMPAFETAEDNFVARCKRASALTITCKPNWYVGDARFHGRATIRATRTDKGLGRLRVSWRIKHTDTYCVEQRLRKRCSTTLRRG